MLVGMTSSRSLRRRAAWAVPAVTAAAIAAAALLPSTASADPHPALPARTPAQLLAAVQSSSVQHLSGTIVETARLGLPSIPGANDTASLSWQTLVTGTHTARVWFDGKDKQRLALLGQLSETDLIRNGNDVWSYASAGQKVGHVVLTPQTEQSKTPDAADPKAQTPMGAADQALRAIDPSTVVSVDRTARVADRPAYTLVLTPRDTRSTVRKVLIAVDAARNVPLRVQVFGASSTPAFETGFTDISFSQPAASVFRFTPPKGATVTHDLFGATGPSRHRAEDGKAVIKPTEPPTGVGETKSPGPKVLGTGWTSVAVFPASTDGSPPLAGLPGGSSAILGQLTTSLPGGARLIKSALVNVLITADGRVLVGAVSPDLLQSYAAGHTG
jgi:outer membrane lipoprotein-sorting protein